MDPIERPTDALLKQLLLAGEDEDAALPAGSKVGRYVVLERIGGGGMGVVYKAYDPQLDRAIALKLMRAAAAENDADASTRILREAQALAKVAHPNIVAVHDAGMFGEQVFAAMEYVAGDTVTGWLQVESRSIDDILEVFRAAGQGLAAAHAAGLVHRDFKPDNVVVGADGRVRVLDFGLARPPGEASAPAASAGSPAYMAPEQHLRRPADARSDQFSFCVALYEAVDGRLPFPTGSAAELTAAVTAGRVREPSADGRTPAWLRPVLLRGMAVDPDQRHASMDALLALLDRRPRRRWALPVAAAAVVVAGALVAMWWLNRSSGADPCADAGTVELTGVWDDAIKERARAAFTASNRGHAEASFARVVRVIDGQAAEWLTVRRDLCKASRAGSQAPRVLALRESCMRQRLGELSRLTARFASADGKIVDSSVHDAFELAGVSACSDVAALELGAPAGDAGVGVQPCTQPDGRYFPLDVGRVWIYDVIDKATRRSRGDPKVVRVDGLIPVGGCKGDHKAYRVSQQAREGLAYRWQEVAGTTAIRHRDQWFDRDGRPTKDEYYVPSRIRLDETCERTQLGATYLDAYDQVEVEPGDACGEELARERRTFDWKVIGVNVPLTLQLDYSQPACCPDGAAPCRPPPDGPGHRCTPAAAPGRFTCVFRALQVDRREVSGGTAATYWFALGIGKVLEDEKSEDREELTCFALPGTE